MSSDVLGVRVSFPADGRTLSITLHDDARTHAHAVIEDPQIRRYFGAELQQLRDEFERWDPKTKALQQVKSALEPLRFLPRSTLALVSEPSHPPAPVVREGDETGLDPEKQKKARL